MQQWKRLTSRRLLDVELTLLCGQTFSWLHTSPSILTGCLTRFGHAPLVVSLQQDAESVSFLCHNSTDESVVEEALADYFQLSVDMKPLHSRWMTGDSNMEYILQALPGLRICRQDPWECFVSFLCSAVNNIPRITGMLKSLRVEAGQ